MSNFKGLSEQVMGWCETLGAISQSSEYLDRRYLTAEHKQANLQVANWMQQAGMHCHQDGVGNLWGRYPSSVENAPRLLLGSHLDTVPNGGKYDGMLGVLAPVAFVHYLYQSQISLPFHIDIVGFCDEEGTRFGTTLLGSRALTGQWQSEWANLIDKDGISMREAMLNADLDFDLVARCKIDDPENLLGYLEIHIEQGPVLEANNLPVGVVTAIAGARRLMFEVKGQAGHAGTVPMTLRQDALAASCEMILAVEKWALKQGVVATVGFIENTPNSVNVISGSVQFSVDIRSDNNALRDETLASIQSEIQQISDRRNVTAVYRETHSAPAVQCDKALQSMLLKAIERANVAPFELPSGAGHDAMAMVDICPVSMLFVRCEKGISHNPAEAIDSKDVDVTLRVLEQFVHQLAEANQTALESSF